MIKIRNIFKQAKNKLIVFFAVLMLFNVTTINAEVGMQSASIELVDRNNEIISTDGNKLTLTIDNTIQKIIETELSNIPKIKKYSFTAIDVKNGEILASFNSSEKYMPSSTLKSAIAAIIIEQKIADKHTKVDDSAITSGDTSIKCWNLIGHGEESFEEAFTNVCGPAFIRLANKLAVKDLILYMNNFGFSISYYDQEDSEKLFYENILGQNFKVTALDMSKFYAAVANDGKLIKERILMNNDDASYIHIMSKETAETIFDLIKLYSTKKNNNITGLAGSAIDENENVNSNFAGVIPYGLKSISLAVNISYEDRYAGNLTSPLNEAVNNIYNNIVNLSN